MANLCDGIPTNHQKTLTNSRAYCEGVQARMESNNPPTSQHPPGSEADDAYIAGVAGAFAGAIEECSPYRGQVGPA